MHFIEKYISKSCLYCPLVFLCCFVFFLALSIADKLSIIDASRTTTTTTAAAVVAVWWLEQTRLSHNSRQLMDN